MSLPFSKGKIKVFISSVSLDKEVKLRQKRVIQCLEARGIEHVVADIAEGSRNKRELRMLMLGKPATPPQIFNGNDLCGDYQSFALAVEDEILEEFLQLETPKPKIDEKNKEDEEVKKDEKNKEVAKNEIKQDEIKLEKTEKDEKDKKDKEEKQDTKDGKNKKDEKVEKNKVGGKDIKVAKIEKNENKKKEKPEVLNTKNNFEKKFSANEVGKEKKDVDKNKTIANTFDSKVIEPSKVQKVKNVGSKDEEKNKYSCINEVDSSGTASSKQGARKVGNEVSDNIEKQKSEKDRNDYNNDNIKRNISHIEKVTDKKDKKSHDKDECDRVRLKEEIVAEKKNGSKKKSGQHKDDDADDASDESTDNESSSSEPSEQNLTPKKAFCSASSSASSSSSSFESGTFPPPPPPLAPPPPPPQSSLASQDNNIDHIIPSPIPFTADDLLKRKSKLKTLTSKPSPNKPTPFIPLVASLDDASNKGGLLKVSAGELVRGRIALKGKYDCTIPKTAKVSGVKGDDKGDKNDHKNRKNEEKVQHETLRKCSVEKNEKASGDLASKTRGRRNYSTKDPLPLLGLKHSLKSTRR